jgi:hypothetical protein
LERALWADLGEDLTQANNDYAALLKEYDKIKREIQAMSETRAIVSIVRNTRGLFNRSGGGIVTRKRHLEKNTRTRKHKIVTISLNKTRRTKT